MRRPPPQDGFTLVFVLVFVLALSVVVAAIVAAARRDHELVRAEEERFRTYSRLEMVLGLALDGLADPGSSWRLRARPYEVELEGVRFVVKILPVAALVDINTARQDVIQRYIELAQLPAARAERLAGAIVDFRDRDDLVVAFGAERAAYRAAGLAGPENNSFRSISDIKFVIGVTPQLAECLAPFLTVDAELSQPLGWQGVQALASLGDGSARSEADISIGTAIEISVVDASGFATAAVVRYRGDASQPFQFVALKRAPLPDRSRVRDCSVY